MPLIIYAGFTNEELYNTQSVFNLVVKENTDINIKFLLGILNSSLMNFYHHHKFLDLSKRLFQKILIQNCKKFPIKITENENHKDKNWIDEIVKNVDVLMLLKKELHQSTLESTREHLQTRLNYCEDKINRLVYQLYDLTENEIRLIEGS